MKNPAYRYFLLSFVMLFSFASSGKEKFELVYFTTEDGARIEASLFKAKSERAVIFAHGAIFNKESWYFLAEKFQKKGVSALAIDFRGYGNSTSGSSGKKVYDILGAISYLQQQGYSDINIVGASMGGAAVLGALSLAREPVARVVVMAPAGGPPIKSDKTAKMFIVSKGERMYEGVLSVYEKSAEPKTLAEYAGSAHAQHMFKEDYADELTRRIMKFILGE